MDYPTQIRQLFAAWMNDIVDDTFDKVKEAKNSEDAVEEYWTEAALRLEHEALLAFQLVHVIGMTNIEDTMHPDLDRLERIMQEALDQWMAINRPDPQEDDTQPREGGDNPHARILAAKKSGTVH